MKKIQGKLIQKIKRRYAGILLIISVIFLLSSCGDGVENINNKFYSTGSVFSGRISTDNSYFGYIEGKEMIQLSTKSEGRVESLFVKEGDLVKKGDLLLKLDSIESKVGYNSSENILNKLYEIKSTTNSLYDKQILSLESQIEKAVILKKSSKDGITDTINITNVELKSSSIELETAQINLLNTINILDIKEKNLYDNSKNSIVNSVILYTKILNYSDILLGITPENRTKNDSFETYLSAKKTSYLNNAEIKFREVNKIYLEYKLFYDNEIEGQTPDRLTILGGLIKGTQLAEELKVLLSILYDVLDNSIENYYFSLETITSYKNDVSIFGNNIEESLLSISGDYILGLQGSKQGLVNFDKSKNNQIEILEKQLLLAKENHSKYIYLSEKNKREVLVYSDISINNLNNIKSDLRVLLKEKELKLLEIDSQISKVMGEKSSVGVLINNGKILSPINGVITSKRVEVGEVIRPNNIVLTVSNSEDLILNILVGENILDNISIGKMVLVQIDGLNNQVTGKILNIYPSKDIVTKKLNVKIELNNIGNNIKIGSYAKAIIQDINNNNSLLISNKAIISKFMIPGIYILENNKAIFTKIEILNQNEQFSEIKGLNIGDIIIIGGKENILDGELLY